jgi:hypothetical protein
LIQMTLSEALHNDSFALESCVFCPLLNLVTSGRQLLLGVPSRHTREEYTLESMVRSAFFVYYQMVVHLCLYVPHRQWTCLHCSFVLYGTWLRYLPKKTLMSKVALLWLFGTKTLWYGTTMTNYMSE